MSTGCYWKCSQYILNIPEQENPLYKFLTFFNIFSLAITS